MSDGVFSIAMTLLVLELKVPELSHHATNDELLAALAKLRPSFLTFFVTFMISGSFWFLHHLTFHFVKHMNQVLCWINLLFLMFVSLLPFSAGLLGHFAGQQVSQLFYFGNQLVLALLLLAHWMYAQKKGLTDTEEHPEQAATVTWRIWSMALAFTAGLLITPLRSEGGRIGFAAGLICMAVLRRLILKRRFRNGS